MGFSGLQTNSHLDPLALVKVEIAHHGAVAFLVERELVVALRQPEQDGVPVEPARAPDEPSVQVDLRSLGPDLEVQRCEVGAPLQSEAGREDARGEDEAAVRRGRGVKR